MTFDEMLAGPGRVETRIGGRRVSNVGFSFTRTLNDVSRATIDLDRSHPSTKYTNLAGEVVVLMQGTEQFVGHVEKAQWKDDVLQLTCSTLPSLDGPLAEAIQMESSPGEQLRVLFTCAGLDEANITTALQEPTEVFEVAIGVAGLSVDDQAHFRDVALLHPDVWKKLRRPFEEDISEDAASVAVTYVTANYLTDAEKLANERIQQLLNWVVVRARYSLPVLPSGEEVDWTRSQFTVKPRMLRPVTIQSLNSRRRLVRGQTKDHGVVGLGDRLKRPRLNESLRLAVSSLARASSSASPIEATVALNDALEFYVAGTVVPARVSKPERRQLRRDITTFLQDGDFSTEATTAVASLLDRINDVPLGAKLRRRLAVDNVPYLEGEFEDLILLRRARNNWVHGKGAEPPNQTLISNVVAFLSRVLVHVAYDTRADPA